MKKTYFLYVIIFLIAVAVGVSFLPRKTSSPVTSIEIKNQTSMNISSKEFQNGDPIPAKFTCQGENINPELKIDGVPAEAKSLALIMDDPDATGGVTWVHWLLWNINPQTAYIGENAVPEGVIEGKTSFNTTGYGGPCPPAGGKPHRYFFKLYALDAALDLKTSATKADMEKAMAGHIIAETQLMGTYVKK